MKSLIRVFLEEYETHDLEELFNDMSNNPENWIYIDIEDILDERKRTII